MRIYFFILLLLFFLIQTFSFAAVKLMKKDFYFGSFGYMSDKKVVDKILGDPVKKDDLYNGFYYNDEIWILYRNNKAVLFKLYSLKYKTDRGIKVGDSKEKLIKLYGEPAEEFDSMKIYQYKASDNIDENLIIEFYLRDNKVEYIIICDRKAAVYFK